MHYFVNKEKYCQICTRPILLYFTLLVCGHFCNEIKRCQLWRSLKYFSILRPMKNDVRFEYVPWKNVWFYFTCIGLLGFTLDIKLKNFDFESHWHTFMSFDQKDDIRFEYFLSNSVWIGLNFIVWVQY